MSDTPEQTDALCELATHQADTLDGILRGSLEATTLRRLVATVAALREDAKRLEADKARLQSELAAWVADDDAEWGRVFANVDPKKIAEMKRRITAELAARAATEDGR